MQPSWSTEWLARGWLLLIMGCLWRGRAADDGCGFSWNAADELPKGLVTSTAQTHRPHLWRAAQNGSARLVANRVAVFHEDGLHARSGGRLVESERDETPQPDKGRPNLASPEVIIEGLLVDGEEATGPAGAGLPSRGSKAHLVRASLPEMTAQAAGLKIDHRILIPPAHHRLEVRFTALGFLAPEKLRFRYQLEPFDRDWVDAGATRNAYYTHLPAGDYRFRVQASSDGLWNQQGAMLAVQVLPPWWLTWWFRAIAAAVIVGSVFWVAEARLNRVRREHAAQRSLSQRLIEAQEEERKRIAAELHDSLGQDLLVIKNRALLGLQEPAVTDKSKEQFTEISRMASTSLAEVREISRDLRPYQLDRLGLTKALHSMITTVAAASGLRCLSQVQPIDGLLATHQEIHCYRIAQELLNNVVKHSHASEARVSAGCEGNQLRLVVEDDGCGMEGFVADGAQIRSPGMGLGDVAERVRILDGRMRCDSRPAQGTRWTIDIPVNTQVKS